MTSRDLGKLVGASIACAVVLSSSTLAAPLFLVDTPFSSPQSVSIYTVDPVTGVMTLRGNLGSTYGPVLGLAAADGIVLYGIGTYNAGTVCAAGATFACLLVRIELDALSTTPRAVDLVGPVRVGTAQVFDLTALGFRNDGALYAFSQFDDSLYVIDPETAQATRVGIATIDLYGGRPAARRTLTWTQQHAFHWGRFSLLQGRSRRSVLLTTTSPPLRC